MGLPYGKRSTLLQASRNHHADPRSEPDLGSINRSTLHISSNFSGISVISGTPWAQHTENLFYCVDWCRRFDYSEEQLEINLFCFVNSAFMQQ